MKILLHICCGPCAVYPVEVLTEAGHQVEGYFDNPNIHPYQEFLKRIKALEDYAAQTGLPVTLGVLTTDTIEQAIERAGTKHGNKGWEAASAAIEMVNLRKSMS